METDIKKIIGQRLQLLRMENHLTQEQMSERLNLSTSAYCKIEYGETDLTLTRLNKIAEIFQMPAIELFGKVNGQVSFNNCHGFVGYSQHNENCSLYNCDDIRELIKANSHLIEMLNNRVKVLEEKFYAKK